jgi:hypothetical protein
VQANLAQSEAFIAGYERARGRVWSSEEREVCWGAGLWLESYDISASIGDVPTHAAQLQTELAERLRLAGL